MKVLRQMIGGAAFCILSASFAMAEPIEVAQLAEPVKTQLSPTPSPTSAVTGEMPWYRSFTLRSSEINDGAFLPLQKPDIEIRANSQWGITVGMEEQGPLLENTERMSAGAFFDISPRIRLGGGLTFTAPGELRTSTPQDRVLPVQQIDQEPVVRVESSIKF